MTSLKKWKSSSPPFSKSFSYPVNHWGWRHSKNESHHQHPSYHIQGIIEDDTTWPSASASPELHCFVFNYVSIKNNTLSWGKKCWAPRALISVNLIKKKCSRIFAQWPLHYSAAWTMHNCNSKVHICTKNFHCKLLAMCQRSTFCKQSSLYSLHPSALQNIWPLGK